MDSGVGRIQVRLGLLVLAGISVHACAWPQAALAEPPEQPFLGISELKIGALYHDVPGLWSGFSVERPAVDANVEVLFAPWARTFGGYLRPAVGATINFNGDTSKAYADLRWEIENPSGVFFALGMGAAFHDGEVNLTDPARKALGSPVLFHPSAEIGYRFDGIHSISIFADHVSNGFTRRYNEGMDTVGLRFGRRLAPILMDERREDVPVGNFAGLYVGAFAGYQHETADWYVTSASAARNEAAWGAYAGYNWQLGRGLFGLELDASPAKRSFAAACDGPAVACQMDLSGLYSARARFGWVIDRMMIYGSGGVAVAPWEASVVNLATGARLDHASGLNYGVAVGAGIEYKPFESFGVRAEVLHYGIAGWDLTLPGAGNTDNQFQSYVARVGVTWYFK